MEQFLESTVVLIDRMVTLGTFALLYFALDRIASALESQEIEE